jgi:hypothetical protein
VMIRDRCHFLFTPFVVDSPSHFACVCSSAPIDYPGAITPR